MLEIEAGRSGTDSRATDTELRVPSQTLFHDADHPSRIVLPTLAD